MSNPSPAQSDSGRAAPAWRIVAGREVAEFWMGGRAMLLVVLYSVVLSILTFLLASNAELSLIPPKEMVILLIKAMIGFAMFTTIIFAADAISGERERGSLEGLLLTPAPRRGLVLGKFLAALSPWPAAFVVTLPYMALLSPDAGFVLGAAATGLVMGTLLVLAIGAFGLIVSLHATTNRTSLAVSLVTFMFVLLPTQLPGTTQTGAVGLFIKHLTPTEAAIHFTEKILVNNRGIGEMSSYLISPVVAAVVLVAVLFWLEAPRLTLAGTRPRRLRPAARGSVPLLVAAVALTVSALPPSAARSEPAAGIDVGMSREFALTRTGDITRFRSEVANSGGADTLPLIAAINIVNLGDGQPVDPEDWSPERTQGVGILGPGQSTALDWEVRSILDGDYLVYLSVIPVPGSAEATSHPVTGQAIHLTVAPYTRLNPGGVLPLVIGLPVLLALLFAATVAIRRRQIA